MSMRTVTVLLLSLTAAMAFAPVALNRFEDRVARSSMAAARFDDADALGEDILELAHNKKRKRHRRAAAAAPPAAASDDTLALGDDVLELARNKKRPGQKSSRSSSSAIAVRLSAAGRLVPLRAFASEADAVGEDVLELMRNKRRAAAASRAPPPRAANAELARDVLALSTKHGVRRAGWRPHLRRSGAGAGVAVAAQPLSPRARATGALRSRSDDAEAVGDDILELAHRRRSNRGRAAAKPKVLRFKDAVCEDILELEHNKRRGRRLGGL